MVRVSQCRPIEPSVATYELAVLKTVVRQRIVVALMIDKNLIKKKEKYD